MTVTEHIALPTLRLYKDLLSFEFNKELPETQGVNISELERERGRLYSLISPHSRYLAFPRAPCLDLCSFHIVFFLERVSRLCSVSQTSKVFICETKRDSPGISRPFPDVQEADEFLSIDHIRKKTVFIVIIENI